jgi:dipeptidyl aminopeptidase/acylaminoacyl peptidase
MSAAPILVGHLLLALFCVVPDPAWAGEIPLTDFARHAQYDAVKISPEGDYLAATAVVKGKRVLALIRRADMKGVNLVPHDSDEVADFWWIDSHRVVYSIDEKFTDLDAPRLTGELYAVNADGSGKTIIAGVRAFGGFQGIAQVIGRVPGDAKHLLVETTPWARESENLFSSAQLIDGAGSVQRLATAPMHRAGFVADNSGEIRFAVAQDEDQDVKVYYRTKRQPEWELLFDAGKNNSAGIPLRFARDDQSAYFACPGDSGVGGVCLWQAPTRTIQTLWSSADSEATELLPTFDGLDVFAIRSVPGRPALAIVDKNAPEATLLRSLMEQFPGQSVQLGSHTRDNRNVIIAVEGDRNPGEFYLYDSEKRKLSFLLARKPWLKLEQLAQMEPVKFAARDGLALHGYLTRPPGKQDAKKLPLVVYVHGGPYGVYDTWGYDPTVQMLASRGYAVLQVNFRGSGGYGDKFRDAGWREWGGKMQDDVTDATHWAVAQGYADPDRLCIFGASYGGYAALEGAVKEPDLYRCAIGYVGIYDLGMMYKRGDIPQSKFGKNYLKRALGENAKELDERSPVAHVDRLKAKVMLIVGGSDSRVPEEQGKHMHAALNSHNIEHEWLYQRNEAHGFYNETHTAQMYEKLLAFLDGQIGAQKASAAGAQ